jgi:hypothetical membrane protein
MNFNILRVLGFAGTGLVILAVFFPSVVYRGKSRERYSLLNHFISELGEVGVSQAAWVFNSGLILGGLVLLPTIVGMGMKLNSALGWLGSVAGVIAVLGVIAVGIFPMNNLKMHAIAAMTYFRSGLLMVALIGLAIVLQPDGETLVPRAANLLSLMAFLAYAAFLTLPILHKRQQRPAELLDPQELPERPRIWALPALEWVVFFATIAWLFGMSFFI